MTFLDILFFLLQRSGYEAYILEATYKDPTVSSRYTTYQILIESLTYLVVLSGFKHNYRDAQQETYMVSHWIKYSRWQNGGKKLHRCTCNWISRF